MLKECRNRTQLKDAMGSLPSDLNDMYDRILASIKGNDAPYAFRMLRWLSFAERLMRIEEVPKVAAPDINRIPVFDPDEIILEPLDVLDICSSLITITDVETIQRQSLLERPTNDRPLLRSFEEGNQTSLPSSEKSPQSSKRVVLLAHRTVKEYLVSTRICKSKMAIYAMDPSTSPAILSST